MRFLGSLGRKISAGLLACALLAGVADAQDLPKPAGEPVLTVTGKISATNDRGAAVLDLAFLKTLPEATVRTTTPWSAGEDEYQGVRMRDLLNRLGAKGTTVTATAMDQYRIDIPMSDFQRYNVIVAYAMDGAPLPLDNKGPLWIIYPFSSKRALANDSYFARSVWQLTALIVQ